MTVNPNEKAPPVVSRAFTWACRELGWSHREAAELLSVSEAELTQAESVGFNSESLQHLTQLAFIRMYHVLYASSDGDTNQMRNGLARFPSHLKISAVSVEDTLIKLNQFSQHLESDNEHDKGSSANHVLPVSLDRWLESGS